VKSSFCLWVGLQLCLQYLFIGLQLNNKLEHVKC